MQKADYYFEKANIQSQVSPEHISKNLITECINLYTKALKVNPEFWQAYRNRSRLYAEVKLYKDAVADNNLALKFCPADERYFFFALNGEDYYRLGDYKEAIRNLSRSIPQDGNPGYSYLLRAKSYWKLDMKAKACKDYSDALKQNPNLIKDKEFLNCD